MLLSRALIVCLVFSPSLAWTCEVFRLEIRKQGNLLYAGSALPINTPRGLIMASADHILPVDITNQNRYSFEFSLVTSGGKSVQRSLVQLLKRDWSSDIMLLSPPQMQRTKLVACRLKSIKGQQQSLRMVGYPSAAELMVNRVVTLIDSTSSETRIANPVQLIQFQGVAEKGMSGGALMSVDDWVGMLIQKSDSRAYALPADFVMQRSAELLAEPTQDLEARLPFAIRRDRLELIAHGFRFRLVEAAPVQSVSQNPIVQLAAAGGGHPDGIGGRMEASALEVVALSGDPVPPSWYPMERILRRIQSEGGAEMIITRTEDGQPLRNLIQLARLILMTPGAPPPLGFSLKTLPSSASAQNDEGIEFLTDRLVRLSLELAELEPTLANLAEAIRRTYSESLVEGTVTTANKIVDLVLKNQDLLSQFPTSQPQKSWNKLIEFRTNQMKLQRLLGKT